MSDADTTKNPTNDYTARIIIAAMTNCQDEEQAAALVAQYMALAPRIQQTLDQSADLVEAKQFREALPLLDEMITRAEQFSRPYPVKAVREVFGYDMARLYFARALSRFGEVARAGASVIPSVLSDLDRAQSYPESCFAELDPEKPKNMREFRAIVEAVQKGQNAYEAKQGASQKSGGVPTATVAWWGALFGLGLAIGLVLLSQIFGYRGTMMILLATPLLALALLIGVSRLVLGRPFPLQRKPTLVLYVIGLLLVIIQRLGFFPQGWVGIFILMVAGAALGLWLVEAKTHIFSGST